MIDQLLQLESEGRAALAAATTEALLEEARVAFLGRNGRLRELQEGMKAVPKEDKPAVGREFNRVKTVLEALLEERQAALAAPASEAGRLDVTLPGRGPRVGRQHPLQATFDELISVFLGLGFTVAEGPEVETYHYGFEALNYPEYHPAMDEQMTFYVTDRTLLRSQTSTVQVRTMEGMQPPVRIIVPGRCYRRDTVDATHCHTFHQLEGLLVDEGITFADLKGTLEVLAKELFGADCHTRFRPDFFPFTEPSAEFAFSCPFCPPTGNCKVCSSSGWLELGGCGMVDPNVLAGVGIDSEKYTGWAFGFGVERIAMLRYGIDDIRLFYNGDMRFLEQF
ncbi:MAG TPA: phenylalanine--tRNA ligase subunit alpha [Armatimonadota bacterium]|jgi:phenylalanyl-tRNA synthetase alpha chain